MERAGLVKCWFPREPDRDDTRLLPKSFAVKAERGHTLKIRQQSREETIIAVVTAEGKTQL